MRKPIIILSLLILILVVIWGVFLLPKLFFRPTPSLLEEGLNNGDTENTPSVEVFARNLSIPWEIVFLPDRRSFITERSGAVAILDLNGNLERRIQIPSVSHSGEGGLLGITLHPSFEENNFVYIYHTLRSGGETSNRVIRSEFSGESFENSVVIIENIPGANIHNGGRIAFGPDGYLYIATGDAARPALSQNLNSLAGKILRITEDGSIPEDNPFSSAVYSYGHRNPQGLVWDGDGRLWSTEHGPRALDEINLITAGGNYGWPEVEGDQFATGMISPVTHSGENETWAPTGIIYLNNSLFFAGLRGESLYEARLGNEGSIENIVSHFRQEFGRLRAVTLGPDNNIYVSTSNTDGRGRPDADDDKIIRINSSIFSDR